MILQLASVIGAVLVLVAYFMITSLAYSPRSKVVLTINGMGSVLLLTVAFMYLSVGYILLNATWLLIVAHGWKRGDNASG